MSPHAMTVEVRFTLHEGEVHEMDIELGRDYAGRWYWRVLDEAGHPGRWFGPHRTEQAARAEATA